jgi:hypothetical protein
MLGKHKSKVEKMPVEVISEEQEEIIEKKPVIKEKPLSEKHLEPILMEVKSLKPLLDELKTVQSELKEEIAKLKKTDEQVHEFVEEDNKEIEKNKNIQIHAEHNKRRFDKEPLSYTESILTETEKQYNETPETNETRRKELHEEIEGIKLYIKNRKE